MSAVLRQLVTTYACTLILLTAVAELACASGVSTNYHQRDGLHVPCTFFDTVNVTGDPKFANGSYLHDGVMIPDHLVGLYDYAYKDLVHRIDVTPHLRGCICKLKTCINFCCPWGEMLDQNSSVCVNTPPGNNWPEPKLNITLPNGELQVVNIYEQFAVQNFRPCINMYSLQPELFTEDDQWNLFKNGSMFRMFDGSILTKNDFCMMPTLANDTIDTVYIINPANCEPETNHSTMNIINAYAMLFSVPFLVLTIVVYLSIPELCNQHGKSLVCYLLGLSIGYTLMSCTILSHHFELVACKVIGYTTYYFFMSAFFWLSVISFDLWHNFRGTRGINRFKENKRFILYSVYSWGAPVVFLVFTMLAQEVLDIPKYLQPGIGSDDYCWLNMTTWSAMIYFFGPVLAIIAANIIMFIMTALKIHKVQREMSRIMAREDSTRNLRSEKDKFGLFLRLFLVMGVTWSLEILSYFVGSEVMWAKFFYITDICNAIQGFLIFMLFVMKKKVKHLITNRLLKRKRHGSSQTSSTHTTYSEYTPQADNLKLRTQAGDAAVHNNTITANNASTANTANTTNTTNSANTTNTTNGAAAAAATVTAAHKVDRY